MATATDLMTTEVPRALGHQTASEVLSALRKQSWEELSHVYLVDN